MVHIISTNYKDLCPDTLALLRNTIATKVVIYVFQSSFGNDSNHLSLVPLLCIFYNAIYLYATINLKTYFFINNIARKSNEQIYLLLIYTNLGHHQRFSRVWWVAVRVWCSYIYFIVLKGGGS